MVIRIKDVPDGRAYKLRLGPVAAQGGGEAIIRVYCERRGRGCRPMAQVIVGGGAIEGQTESGSNGRLPGGGTKEGQNGGGCNKPHEAGQW